MKEKPYKKVDQNLAVGDVMNGVLSEDLPVSGYVSNPLVAAPSAASEVRHKVLEKVYETVLD